MQLTVGLLHQLDPELLGIAAGAVEADSVVLLLLVRQQRVNDNLRPLAVLEELEGHEAFVEVLFLDDQFFEELSSVANDGQRADEVACCEEAVLGINIDVLAIFILLEQDEARILDHFLGPLPLQILEKHSPVRQVGRVLVELRAGSWKVLVDPLLTRIVR